MLIKRSLDTHEKLSLLSRDSQYDLACACGSTAEDQRRRNGEGKWIYPVTLPDGRKQFLFKILISNSCINDCAYCPLRADSDGVRCTASAEEIVRAFMDYYRRKMVQGIFLSSGVTHSPDSAMERINTIAGALRHKEGFRGYVHLKIIPGSSDAAIEKAVSLATTVSVNIETPGEKHFEMLSEKKNYLEDIIRPMKLISSLAKRDAKFKKKKATTQFVVGAAGEPDRDIIRYMDGLYRRLGFNRVYFSAYQRGLGKEGLPGELSRYSNADMLTREHRLYQVDWLLRKYGFGAGEIPLEEGGNLSLEIDPKECWALSHPELFPLDINSAGKFELLRVPGFGEATVNRILRIRTDGCKVRSLDMLSKGKPGKRLEKAGGYIKFGY